MERNIRQSFTNRRREVVTGAVLATAISFGLAGSGAENSSGKQPTLAARIPSSEFLPITVYNESPPPTAPKGPIEIVVPSLIPLSPTSAPEPTPTPVRTLEPIPEHHRIIVPDLKPKKITTRKTGLKLDPEISWYGPKFYGNRTACGEKLTKSLMGVANRTLPCGTLITFEWKGNKITVPVVDRGPYVSGRIFDLTNGACKALNHCYTGPIYYKIGK